ncbi:MAG: hypothetical protein QOI16_3255 [Pseudonocardiales bacterium]|nr:hypothetical protein [Pseudonocardiales bacterium]
MKGPNRTDVTHRISAVARTVGSRTLPAGQARVVTISRTYREPVEDIWDACTTAERIARWFLPVSGELRLGGRFQLEGNAGGTVERCDPPRAFAATWEFGGDVSWIEVRLDADEAGTRFTVEHIAHVDDTRWTEFGPGAVGVGWDMILLGMTMHLDSGAVITPAEGDAWRTSPEGVQFTVESSAAWCAAAIAAGEEPEWAEAAAKRTTAAYTGTA